MDVIKWYSFGQGKCYIIHTKLRLNNSSLNYDWCIFNLGIKSGCKCGFECENCFHFFMECSLYDNIRQK
jgi:hypothetical protein